MDIVVSYVCLSVLLSFCNSVLYKVRNNLDKNNMYKLPFIFFFSGWVGSGGGGFTAQFCIFDEFAIFPDVHIIYGRALSKW